MKKQTCQTHRIKSRPAILGNESGILTLDFLFSFALIFGMTLILFAVCLSLSVFEVTQYITFAVARNYHAAHVTRQLQTSMAETKFDQLSRSTPAFSSLFGNGWYRIGNLEVGPEADVRFLSEYNQREDRNTFVGARVTVNAKVLEIRIPFFGETYQTEDGFVSKVSTFLGRAPTTEECLSVNVRRLEEIRRLDPGYEIAVPNSYSVQADNGC